MRQFNGQHDSVCNRRPWTDGRLLCRRGVLPLIFAVALAGCTAKPAGPSKESFSAERLKRATSAVERGPVRVTAELRPPRAQLSDELVLTLTIDAAEGVKIQKPEFGETLGAGAFTVRNFREPLPTIRDGRQTIRQIYTLEPTQAGRLKIDPIRVAFVDGRPKGDGREHAIETDSLSVEITSSLGDKTPSLGDFRPAAGPFDLPSGIFIVWWLLLAAAVAVAAAVLAWRLRRGRREPTIAPTIFSHEELAHRELDRLVESGLAERDIKSFYIELTGIVRRYIEYATGIRAPEQTTEEFLREISRTRAFGRDACSRLRDFLESADLVKFAAFRPGSDDAAESVRRARAFIGLRSLPVIGEPRTTK